MYNIYKRLMHARFITFWHLHKLRASGVCGVYAISMHSMRFLCKCAAEKFWNIVQFDEILTTIAKFVLFNEKMISIYCWQICLIPCGSCILKSKIKVTNG